MSCILIVGGTFDPPHRAHRELPAVVARVIGAARIVYVPAARNPLKADGPVASDAHRLAMLRLVVAQMPGAPGAPGAPEAEVSTIEIDRGGPSYFVETLAAFAAEVNGEREDGDGTPLRFLIGADQAIDFDRWKQWRRILELATPAVVLRPPWSLAAFDAALRERWDDAEVTRWTGLVVETPLIDVSATGVRSRLRAGSSVDDLLDPAVAEYIHRHGLYRK